MIIVSFQEARPRSPKVQKTTAATCTSWAKYWIRMVPAEKREPSATPASTIASGEKLRILASIRMTRAATIAQPNAQIVTRYGLSIDTAAERELWTLPAPSTMIATLAPNAAALAIPSVDGDASGL